ncbi:nickel-dependent lactate racemase [Garciella nitratireducens]|uniref:Nickel-dependent lactate racemase n=1 Tax=Garciella nitratireducens DSM 15102 TaxID=1121911 RepID=A0A1T4LNA0_9FIRM|nr:nickel-dependent lactate racemase [Garciella nitratireducens]RBP46878.1 nickel-dependent lactate racemase [Garciella nitratireducens]SJZ56185.1 Nickel-dependent lactate racemase [Garciella nitratireducens DSM 15102]
MKVQLGFGKEKLEVIIEDQNILNVLKPNNEITDVGQIEEVRRALQNPIGTKYLKDIVKPNEKIVIITSDITRPMPSKIVLPEVIEELLRAGVSFKDLKVIFALGSHRKHTEEEKKQLVGEDIFSKVQCMDSDRSDCIRMGKTSHGTPVDIYKEVALADRRICLGNIEYHYFAGYSGGAKAIMPGVSSREAIQSNHSMMVKEQAKAGEIDNNPVRQDLEEVISFVPIDFIVNVVLNEKKKIIKAVAGHYIEAHREGCKFLDDIYKIPIKELADIVIVSPGGYPKDINMYQAQKALDNAKHAVKEGGIIIWVANCQEGFGEKIFEKWIIEADYPNDMVESIQSNFELGGHKAAAIGMVLNKCKDIYMVSGLKDEIVKEAFLVPFHDVNSALNQAFCKLGKDAKVIVMPYGGSTLPVLDCIN